MLTTDEQVSILSTQITQLFDCLFRFDHILHNNDKKGLHEELLLGYNNDKKW